MKKFTKICLILVSIFLVLGLVFATVGVAIGFRAENLLEYGFEKQENNFKFSADEIKNLNVNVDVGRLKIYTSKEEEIKVSIKAGKGTYECYQDGNKLIVNQEKNSFLWRFFRNKGTEVTIYIPEKLQLENNVITLGAGEAYVDGLDGERIDIQVGAGRFKGKSIQADSQLILSVGAGEIELEQIKAKDTTVECGIGSITIEGKIDGNVSADCGVGEIVFNLEGEEDDFNYQVKSGIGNIIINSIEFQPMGANQKIDNDADKTFDLQCGVGSIEITID